MSSVESTFNEKQKENLEEARKIFGFRSRADVIRWFADHAKRIAEEEREREVEKRKEEKPTKSRFEVIEIE